MDRNRESINNFKDKTSSKIDCRIRQIGRRFKFLEKSKKNEKLLEKIF